MTENLKRCPFCGSEARVERINLGKEGLFRVICPECLTGTTHLQEEEKNAVAEWNSRPIEDALQKELDESREDNVDNMEYHVAERERLKKEIVNVEAENKMLIGALKAIKKIVDKPPLSIYDAARIYAECCEALGEKNDA